MAGVFRDFAVITDKLIVGSQPQNAADINTLYNSKTVRAIESLQERKEDLRDFNEKEYCDQNRIAYERVPIIDHTTSSLQAQLPVAVGILDKAIREKVNRPEEKVYLHCHAGLGRSPSVAAAYLYWFRDEITLDKARKDLQRDRENCDPDEVAIGGATQAILREVNNGQGNYQGPPEAFSKISSEEKAKIKDYLKEKLPEVRNAWP